MIQTLKEKITITQTGLTPQATKTIKGYVNFFSEMRLIAHLIYKGGNNIELKEKTLGVNGEVKQFTPSFSIANFYHNWVRDNIRYVPDVSGLESLQEPLITFNKKFGDCDDMTILLCSMLKSIGYDVGVVGINVNSGEFNHVYSVIRTNEGWFFSDTTGKDNPFGYEAPLDYYTKKHIVFIE